MTRALRTMAFAGLAALATPAQAERAQNAQPTQNTAWQFATGFDYSVGRYGGTSDTTMLSVPLNVRVQTGRLRLEASLPYLRVRGPGVATGGVVVGGSGAVTTRSGLGDLNLGAAWLLNKDGTVPAIELEGLVKVPTAGSGLGTGKFDYTGQLNIAHNVTPRVMLFGTFGYQWLSNFKTYTLENGVLASAGVNFKPAADTSVGVSANYRQEYYAGLGDQFSVSPYVLWGFTQNWRVSAYGLLGTTKASPRWGGGLRLIFSQ